MADSKSPSPDSPTNEEHHIDLDGILKWLGPTIAGVLILSMLFIWQRNQGDGIRNEVSRAFTVARTAEDLEAVAQAYPDQPEAPMALLQSASQRFNNGEFENALTSYQSFLSLYAEHPLREYAEWGLWMTQEQQGQLDSALQGFRSVPEEALFIPQALLAQARVLEKQSKPSEAIEVYAKVQESFPETPWSEQARVFSQQASLSISE